jgi:phosphoglycolate phosphatase
VRPQNGEASGLAPEVLHDLDGTLVRLAVDWDRAAREAAAALARAGVAVDGDRDLWAMLDVADERGVRRAIEAVVVRHEVHGARTSDRLPLADDVVGRDGPLGVCSLNAEGPVRAALRRHDLAGRVGAVVGRDTVATRKPDPAPLLATLDGLGVDPTGAVFVGDSERDALTAERAGVAFRYVGAGPSGG